MPDCTLGVAQGNMQVFVSINGEKKMGRVDPETLASAEKSTEVEDFFHFQPVSIEEQEAFSEAMSLLPRKCLPLAIRDQDDDTADGGNDGLDFVNNREKPQSYEEDT